MPDRIRGAVESGQSSQVSLSQSWLEQPLKSRAPDLLLLCQENLEQSKRDIEDGESAGARLKQLFFRAGTNLPNLDDAAMALGLSPRTLRRRLQAEGVSYRSVADAYRAQLALEHLRRGSLTTKALSAKTGFEDVNAFRRAFKKWTGTTVRKSVLSV